MVRFTRGFFCSPLHLSCSHPRRENTGRDPFNQNSNRSDREKRTPSKGGPVFSKLFRLDRTDPLSFGPKFPEILVEWIAPTSTQGSSCLVRCNFNFSLFDVIESNASVGGYYGGTSIHVVQLKLVV